MLNGVCRWAGTEFETLIMVEHLRWCCWVPSIAVKIDEPLKIIYRRRHHRELYKVGNKTDGYVRKCRRLGDKSSAETMNIYFEQLNVNLKALTLGIIEANKINAI